MYERAFDVDWASLSGEEALRRMYSLGVATELGHERPEERARIQKLASSAYERSVLDLAFEEGRRKVKDIRSPHDTDEETWTELVESVDDPSPSRESLTVDSIPEDVPDAVDRPPLLGGFSAEDLGRLRLPSLLERSEE
ncbi:MAG: hypothetical protein ABEI27_10935 [Halobellus sp.]|uniref:hypothetical protein n=1 Tax=Halobellus sp. TaxID=1979212 RepID=UPI0035D4C643